MGSLTESTRSSGPLVLLVAFSVVFAAAWEQDRPQQRAGTAVSSPREPTMAGDITQASFTPPVPAVSRDGAASPFRAGQTGILAGVRQVTDVCAHSGPHPAAATVGSQLRTRRIAESQHPQFAGGAAFLHGTMEDEDRHQTAGTDRDAGWSME